MARVSSRRRFALDLLTAAVGGVDALAVEVVDGTAAPPAYSATGLGNELFFSIAAAVVGGVSLFGGTGTVPGAMIGAILIATVSNGMNVLNVSSYWQSLVIGSIILLGVSFDTYRRGLSGRSLLSVFGGSGGGGAAEAPRKQKEPTAV